MMIEQPTGFEQFPKEHVVDWLGHPITQYMRETVLEWLSDADRKLLESADAHLQGRATKDDLSRSALVGMSLKAGYASMIGLMGKAEEYVKAQG